MFRELDMKPHHIGYAVRDITASAASFEALGFVSSSDLVYDGGRNVNIQFIDNAGTRIELIATADVSKPSDIDFITRSKRKIGVTPYHICYEVDDLDKKIAALRAKRFAFASDIAPAPACAGMPVVFLYHRDIGLIELLQKKRKKSAD
jgi:methylmalonyl-CoA/ethylmalonyl-CoA epimerase